MFVKINNHWKWNFKVVNHVNERQSFSVTNERKLFIQKLKESCPSKMNDWMHEVEDIIFEDLLHVYNLSQLVIYLSLTSPIVTMYNYTTNYSLSYNEPLIYRYIENPE